MESLRLHLLGLCSKQVLAVVMLWQGSLWDVRAQNELVFRIAWVGLTQAGS